MNKAKLTAPPVGLVIAILAWLFGKQLSGPELQLIGQVATGALAVGTVAVHKNTLGKVVMKVKSKTQPKKPAPNKPLTMYDSIDVSTVPDNPQAVAGYVGGRWPDFSWLVNKFPKAHHLSIAISSTEAADCLDVEPGDASVASVPAWVDAALKRGVKRPCIYASISQMPAILLVLRAAGIPRTAVRLWTAHYTYKPHVCTSKCWATFNATADMTQYTDKALGRNLDASYGYTHFFS